ncbi:MAG: NUDIX hydrolase [Parachlamydiaceae bacterium]|nr:NUDIX hydrolase [Parachlamydiaceae bacterium]
MNLENQKKSVEWIAELKSIAQNGLAYSKDSFDLDRYAQLEKLCVALASNLSSLGEEKITELFSHDTGYATPKIDVRGALFKNDKIMLVRENSDSLWTVPGGWADVNESPSEAVEREVIEETGYKTKAIKLIALYDKLKQEHPIQLPHTYKCFFLCKIVCLKGLPDKEISEIGFFAQNKLPPLSMKRVTPKQIARCFAHYQNFDLPSEFD